jgi:hypothetical protein
MRASVFEDVEKVGLRQKYKNIELLFLLGAVGGNASDF